jgi:DNA-binding GntR family transcriptional regulator
LIVETEALRKITPEERTILQKLEDCIKMAEVHLQNENMEELQKTNTEYHSNIISALQNNKLKQFVDSLQDTISRYRTYSLTNIKCAKSLEDDHSQILNYLKQGETELAVRVLRQHLTTAVEIL